MLTLAWLLLASGTGSAMADTTAVAYCPPFSEFVITFPAQPRERVFAFTGIDGVDAEALSAELTVDDSVLKAEFLPIADPTALNAIEDDQIRSQGLEYMRQNGITAAEAVVEHRGAVRLMTVRGTKLISHNGKKIPTTYLNKAYYGRRTLLILYTGARSADYPTPAISDFLASVRLRD